MGARHRQVVLTGAAVGAVFGLIASHLYARAAEDSDNPEARSISASQLLGVLLTALGLLRQIIELGKPKKDDKAQKK